MTRDVRVPKWGLSITHVTIVTWLVSVGTTVLAGDPLCEVETDKANSEIESPASGVVSELCAPAGSECAVGDVIARLEAD